ncbi:Uncharacterised protein [uncultured archaeon]|nr:Uncharacterised protein [uncultured archaeon]
MNFLRNVLIFSAFLVFAFLVVANLNNTLNVKGNVAYLSKGVQDNVFTNIATFVPPLNCRIYDNKADFDSDRGSTYVYSSATKGVLSQGGVISVNSTSNACVWFWCDKGDNNSYYCYNGMQYKSSIDSQNFGQLCVNSTGESPNPFGEDERFSYFWWDGTGVPGGPPTYPDATQVTSTGNGYSLSLSDPYTGFGTPTGSTCQVGVKEMPTFLTLNAILAPMPVTNGHFTITIPSYVSGEVYNVKLYSEDGRQYSPDGRSGLTVTHGYSKILEINLGRQFSAGVYFAEIIYGHYRAFKPFIVMKN